MIKYVFNPIWIIITFVFGAIWNIIKWIFNILLNITSYMIESISEVDYSDFSDGFGDMDFD